MPTREPIETPEVTVISDSRSTTVEEVPNTVESETELIVTAEVNFADGQKVDSTDTPSNVQTPMITLSVGCSTERANRRPIPDKS